jgi:hypothetical protein
LKEGVIGMRVLPAGLLVLAGLLSTMLLLADGASIAAAQSDPGLTVAQQPPVSTIPPIPATATPARPVVVSTPPLPSPTPTRAVPAVPAAPPVSPPRPTAAPPAPSQQPPRAGGFPTELAVLVLAGSVTAFGGGLWMFARSRMR